MLGGAVRRPPEQSQVHVPHPAVQPDERRSCERVRDPQGDARFASATLIHLPVAAVHRHDTRRHLPRGRASAWSSWHLKCPSEAVEESSETRTSRPEACAPQTRPVAFGNAHREQLKTNSKWHVEQKGFQLNVQTVLLTKFIVDRTGQKSTSHTELEGVLLQINELFLSLRRGWREKILHTERPEVSWLSAGKYGKSVLLSECLPSANTLHIPSSLSFGGSRVLGPARPLLRVKTGLVSLNYSSCCISGK